MLATSKAVGRAFNDALAVRGGSLSIWLILNALKSEPRRTQLELARAVGIEGPTMTRHLDGLEEEGSSSDGATRSTAAPSRSS